VNLVGTTLSGKYRLDRVLGEGGMATVYRATHVRNASKVAVKVLHPDVARDKDLRTRFLREGYAANTVGHSGTVRVLDDDVTKDGLVYLVMDLLEGKTLSCDERLSPSELVHVLDGLLEVLEAAHKKNVIHRDIKPENLFLTKDGELKILDFGIAKIHGSHLTTGTFGTPAFMGPEQALGKGVDALSDLWAVGATAFTLLTGLYVHEGSSPGAVLVRAATKPARPILTVAPEVPEELAQIVDKALAFDKRDRWPSAKAMRAALAQVQLSVPLGYAATLQVRTRLLRREMDTTKTQLTPLPAAKLRHRVVKMVDAVAVTLFVSLAAQAGVRTGEIAVEAPRELEEVRSIVALEAKAPREPLRLVSVTSLPRMRAPAAVPVMRKDPLAP